MEAENLVPGVEGAAVGNWAEMPTDVVMEIGAAIKGIEDYVRFASVCKSWYSPLSSRWECPKSSKRLLGYPWLMLVEEERREEEGEERERVRKRGFYSLCSGKQFNLDLPESYGRACHGSSCGWLLTLGLDLKMHLLNPITREQLPLPSQTTFTHQRDPNFPTPNRFDFIHKVFVIYDNPVAATEDRRTPLVFVIYSQYRKVAMARPGDSSWTPLLHPSLDRGFFDFSSFRDQVIVFNRKQICRCHFSGWPPRLEDLCAAPLHGQSTNIVELGGELHTLCSFHKESPPPYRGSGVCTVTKSFKAFKLDFGKKNWKEVDTLGGWTVFVGWNSTFALSSSDYPQCRPNCIYFTDQKIFNIRRCGGCDWGIYDYDNRCKENGGVGEETPREITLNPFPISHDQFSTYSPLLWMVPNLW